MKPQRCPLAGIDGATMTRNGFISACLARQSKEIKMDPCPDCEEGQAINMGKWPGAPKGIWIYIPKTWTPGPIIFPADNPTQKSRVRGGHRKYPFVTMAIGEIFEGNIVNKGKLRTAAGAIGRNHGKKFINHINGDQIIFERIE